MKRLAIALVLVAGMALLPGQASAVVVPGPNGPIIFTSGRDAGGTILSDINAQIWMLSGGAQRISLQDTQHHRHASWSPDRTKIAYASGTTGFAGPWDIWVRDFTQPISLVNPRNLTNTPALLEDRPSWSPDGTQIVYAGEQATGFWNVYKRPAAGGGQTLIAQDASVGAGASGQFSRPQWSADGSEIYYARVFDINPDPMVFTPAYDIYRSSSAGGDIIGDPIVTGNTNDYQPALSADGTKLCFTRQTGGDKNVVVYSLTSNTETDDDLAPGGIDYECAWSPDGQRIAFSRGGFDQGQLMARNSDGTGITDTLTNIDGRFDGNAEWTFNPRPACEDVSKTVAVNGFVSVPVACTDDPDPPGFGPNSPFEADIITQPANGSIGSINDDTVIYTPKKDFKGTDTFAFMTSDGNTDSDPATATITVKEGGGGGGSIPGVNPELTGVGVSPKRFRRGSALPSLLSAAKGTTISFTLSEDARATLSFRRARPGRRVRGRCVKPTRTNRAKPKCTRYVRAGAFAVDAKSGNSRVRFQGRLPSGKRLKLGRYRLFVRATDADGDKSKQLRASFRIVRR